ncbi:hypothetical protein N0V91_000065 [Didymella pomorum]|uniref:BTB domain-containing protein n=1 Tax=Didymella pomorum TaxID=749634 RepID=A0A9W8ZNR0_9PLEO|nr:hypothetical protein N0V91_000065 [Didymella pomorum]
MPFAISILHSKLCIFPIDMDEAPVTVHSGATSALSAPLDRAINGHSREALEKCVHSPDIEPEHFEKICAVAYRAELPAPAVSHVLCATIGNLNDLPNVPARTGSKALYDNNVDDYS